MTAERSRTCSGNIRRLISHHNGRRPEIEEPRGGRNDRGRRGIGAAATPVPSDDAVLRSDQGDLLQVVDELNGVEPAGVR